jgi:glycosyltransferase involved in cell wall biosynthesis
VRITFVLPGSGHLPVGGFKVVYEYANRLVGRGHAVTVVHSAQFDREAPAFSRLKTRVRFVQRSLDGSYRPGWFALRPEVRLLWRATPAPAGVPDADVVVATAWQTAEWVADYPAHKGRKFYLIQHYETWSGPEARVNSSFTLGLHNLAIARWLQEVVKEQGAEADYLPNGLDFSAFGVDIPLRERAPRAMMLYHEADWKGSADGLKALKRVKAVVPELEATLFGTPAVPAGLPPWIRYERRPTPEVLRRRYNESAVFLATSWTEGWGLPGCEALLCGCALAATDVGGHREFARHQETALLSPPKDPAALAQNVVTLLQDDGLRVRLAEGGRAYVQRFTWERAVARLEQQMQGSR